MPTTKKSSRNVPLAEAEHERWLKRNVAALFGKRCPDYTKGCGCCDAWYVYDAIMEENRGLL